MPIILGRARGFFALLAGNVFTPQQKMFSNDCLVISEVCTLPSESDQSAGHIAKMSPVNGTIDTGSSNTVTMGCETGWTFSDGSTTKEFKCTGVETFNPSLEYCNICEYKGDWYSLLFNE